MENKNTPHTTIIKKNSRTYRCNECGGTIYRHEVFCSHCGKKLDHYDFEE